MHMFYTSSRYKSTLKNQNYIPNEIESRLNSAKVLPFIKSEIYLHCGMELGIISLYDVIYEMRKSKYIPPLIFAVVIKIAVVIHQPHSRIPHGTRKIVY
jgi:hypothetical protein